MERSVGNVRFRLQILLRGDILSLIRSDECEFSRFLEILLSHRVDRGY